jgi:4a-hydroxytetrahydrobiopterin dehydratase
MAEKLAEDQIRQALGSLDGWTRSGDAIEKTYKFKDFVEAMAFVNRVAEEAEAAEHHPDIDIRWNVVKMSLSTHSEGGLTHKDIHMAGRIDAARTPSL